MKKDALTFFKSNMSELYQYYYQNPTNDWMQDVYGKEVFEDFIEIPDFELASLYGRTAGEIDLDNCKIVYGNLMMLSESQASDERLWAGLCNNTFYDYMRRRFQYDSKELKDPEKDASGIISRFFYTYSGRSGFFRNSISKAWWVGRLSYDSQAVDKFAKLTYLGSSDFSSKVSDIFYSNSYSANPVILKGICDAIQHYNEKGIKLLVKEHIRPALQYLNALGGGTLLDFYSDEEIKKIMIKRIYEAAASKGNGLIDFKIEDDETAEVEESELEVSEIDELIIGDFVEEEDEEEELYVSYNCIIQLMILEKNSIIEKAIPDKSVYEEQKNLLMDRMLGKKVGFETLLAGNHYRIMDIVKN